MSWFTWKMVDDVFGRLFSMLMSLLDIFRMRGLLPFSGVILIVAFSVSRSVHFSLHASPHLAPVSFSSCRKVAVLLVQLLISWSISVSVGMNGSFLSLLHIGGSHFRLCIWRKLV